MSSTPIYDELKAEVRARQQLGQVGFEAKTPEPEPEPVPTGPTWQDGIWRRRNR
ncbi:hypothetical protein E3_1875 [Rhodococcus phage E3]|uniref:hypothetical protein n=1 Tax=Rhodococcus phage E3 TaxID=1007869 RepID=UPI0002C6B5D2|nr:hypothetical protein M176_gp198 [Rhodococcus phage E3]AEQ21106.1 hypothetical protein E3_1875 [Rhodococcus phage E3]